MQKERILVFTLASSKKVISAGHLENDMQHFTFTNIDSVLESPTKGRYLRGHRVDKILVPEVVKEVLDTELYAPLKETIEILRLQDPSKVKVVYY
jgi:hypothetical protein